MVIILVIKWLLKATNRREFFQPFLRITACTVNSSTANILQGPIYYCLISSLWVSEQFPVILFRYYHCYYHDHYHHSYLYVCSNTVFCTCAICNIMQLLFIPLFHIIVIFERFQSQVIRRRSEVINLLVRNSATRNARNFSVDSH